MVKVAIIGAGNITSLRHIPALKRSGRVEVSGIIDRTEDKARAVAARFGIPDFGTTLDEPWMEEVSAVTIGVPPQAHFQTCKEAFSRGKHVLMEKPITLQVEEGEELCRIAGEKK